MASRVRSLVEATLSSTWFKVVLFLVAVPPPAGLSACSYAVSEWVLPGAALVIGFLVCKAIVWKKRPHVETAAHDPWFIMVLLLVASHGIMISSFICLGFFLLLAPYGYPPPLHLALGFIIYRAAFQAEPGPVELFRPKNPWLGVLLILIGFPAVTVYLSGFIISLAIVLPLHLTLFALLCLFSVIVYMAGRRRRKERGDGGKRGKNAWLSLLLHLMIFLPLPFAEIFFLDGNRFLRRIWPPLELLPLLLVLIFCGYKAMTWKQRQQAER